MKQFSTYSDNFHKFSTILRPRPRLQLQLILCHPFEAGSRLIGARLYAPINTGQTFWIFSSQKERERDQERGMEDEQSEYKNALQVHKSVIPSLT